MKCISMFTGDCLSRKSSIVLLYLHDLFNKKTFQANLKQKVVLQNSTIRYVWQNMMR